MSTFFSLFLYSSQSREDLQFKRFRENLSLVSHHFSALGNACLLLGITFSLPYGRERERIEHLFCLRIHLQLQWQVFMTMHILPVLFRHISFLESVSFLSPDETKYAGVCRVNQEKSVLHESSSDLTVFMHTVH